MFCSMMSQQQHSQPFVGQTIPCANGAKTRGDRQERSKGGYLVLRLHESFYGIP